MSSRKLNNSIFVAARCICIGIVLVCTGSFAFGQGDSPKSIEVNKRPLYDFTRYASDQADSKNIDFSKQFSVKLDGYITADGKFDGHKSKFISYDGDPNLVDLAKHGIEAVGDSGLLAYLSILNVEHTTVIISQDGAGIISLSLASDAKSKEAAQTTASGLRMVIEIGRTQSQAADDKYLLEQTSVESSGSRFTIRIAAPFPKVKELILRK